MVDQISELSLESFRQGIFVSECVSHHRWAPGVNFSKAS